MDMRCCKAHDRKTSRATTDSYCSSRIFASQPKGLSCREKGVSSVSPAATCHTQHCFPTLVPRPIGA